MAVRQPPKDWRTYDPLAEAFDIVGYNYMIHNSESDHERDPQRVMMQTESYPNDAWSNFRKAADNPYIVGDFVWTAIDYLGESGIARTEERKNPVLKIPLALGILTPFPAK